MLDAFLKLAVDPGNDATLRDAVDRAARVLRATTDWDRRDAAQLLVRSVESAVAADPQGSFAFDQETATLSARGSTWPAGRFATPTISELRERAQRQAPAAGCETRLWVLDGSSPVTDIGSLQATANPGSLFQVASQFNCLESPGAYVTDVSYYFGDATQGPRASISAFPATLLRHYSAPAPDGRRFVQRTDGPQIDLLADVFEPGQSPVRNGYLKGDGMAATDLVAALEHGLDRLRVGVHEEVGVVFGHDWGGTVEDPERRRITQVFTSTVAGGMYSGERNLGSLFEPACRQTLCGAYLGTLLAAVAQQRSLAVLTLIGGGVFGNPVELIWEAMLWAFDEIRPLATQPLDVVLNGYNLSRLIDLTQFLLDVRERGGAILRFGISGLVEVLR